MEEVYIMEPISQSSCLKKLHIDLMIVAASADQRAYEGIRSVLHNGIYVEKLLVLKFKSQQIFADDPLYEAYNQYAALEIPVVEVELPEDDIAVDLSVFEGRNILIDITSFTIPNLFRLLFVLRTVIGITDFHILYTEPKHYTFEADTFGSYAYFIGEREYKALDEFYISGDDKEILTIFLGFDRMTSSLVKEAVNPTETILVNGFPSMTPKLKDVSLLNNRELISVVGKPRFSVKTNNPFSTYNVLQKIQQEHPDTLINVCVLGTKAMALGAGIYALQNKNIKLSYAHTKKGAAKISYGVSNTWYYHFMLSKCP